jgi:DNA invertase Pin-like site-specific DNA recombinase
MVYFALSAGTVWYQAKVGGTVPKTAERHAAVYSRVSSASQDLRSQKEDLTRWASSADEPFRYYDDSASGKTMDRPAWQRLWAEVAAGRVSRVVVWRLDRLGRTARGLAELFEELGRRKVGLVSIREGVDLDTPAGRLMAHVIASVAQYETEVRGERQRAGIAAAIAAGQTFGRPKGTGKPLKVTPEVRAEVFRMKSQGGHKIAAIARLLNLSRNTVYGIVRAGAGGDAQAVR